MTGLHMVSAAEGCTFFVQLVDSPITSRLPNFHLILATACRFFAGARLIEQQHLVFESAGLDPPRL